MKARKKGRPAAQGTPVGLKPYLSPAAVDFLNQQKSKSAFVARLIEKAVDQVQDGHGHIHVFFAEVEVDDETIQEGLQAINVAANKIFQSTPTESIKVLPVSATSHNEDEFLEEPEL